MGKKQVTRLYFTTTLPPRKAIKSFKVRNLMAAERKQAD